MALATRPSDEINPLSESNISHDEIDRSVTYRLSDKAIVRIARLRLVGCCRDFPFWDLSYCYGQLADGTLVPVSLERGQFSRNYKGELLQLCKDAARYGKALGIFEAVSLLPG